MFLRSYDVMKRDFFPPFMFSKYITVWKADWFECVLLQLSPVHLHFILVSFSDYFLSDQKEKKKLRETDVLSS